MHQIAARLGCQKWTLGTAEHRRFGMAGRMAEITAVAERDVDRPVARDGRYGKDVDLGRRQGEDHRQRIVDTRIAIENDPLSHDIPSRCPTPQDTAGDASARPRPAWSYA